jgi:hypothetical protein
LLDDNGTRWSRDPDRQRTEQVGRDGESDQGGGEYAERREAKGGR